MKVLGTIRRYFWGRVFRFDGMRLVGLKRTTRGSAGHLSFRERMMHGPPAYGEPPTAGKPSRLPVRVPRSVVDRVGRDAAVLDGVVGDDCRVWSMTAQQQFAQDSGKTRQEI